MRPTITEFRAAAHFPIDESATPSEEGAPMCDREASAVGGERKALYFG